MPTALLVAVLLVNVVAVVVLVLLLHRSKTSQLDSAQSVSRLEMLEPAISQKLATATADMATRLEQTKGDLRQQLTDRLTSGFAEIRTAVEQQLTSGRNEQAARMNELSTRQAESLAASRQELASSLALTTSQLTTELDAFNQRTAQSLEAIRIQVDEKLLAISGHVQQKLDENIREGFAHFTKVQDHLKSAEEQLRQVGALGASINDLNNLLKLPHLRGKDFGEGSLKQLLADFLPASMYALQVPVGGGRVDAMINFPDRRLPIDAKFPREQVLPLFETSDSASLSAAREQLVKVLKAEAKRIAVYIQPEHGTMDVALMYLPSETLYMEAITNPQAIEALTILKIFPVSPNTLMMTVQTIALAHKWYEVAARFEETRKELGKAQTSLGHFHKNFERVGTSLEKAQSAFDTAARHLKQYRTKVTAISGEQVPEIEGEQPIELIVKTTIPQIAASADEE